MPNSDIIVFDSIHSSFVKLIDAVLATIGAEHQTREPASSATLERLRSIGMPPDVIYFYSKSNGALIHRSESEYDIPSNGSHWQWELLSAEDIESVADSGWSHSDSPLHQYHTQWFNIVDVQNGDCLTINLEDRFKGEILDTFHETLNNVGYNQIIAKSFTEVIVKLVGTKACFWLNGESGYGYR